MIHHRGAPSATIFLFQMMRPFSIPTIAENGSCFCSYVADMPGYEDLEMRRGCDSWERWDEAEVRTVDGLAGFLKTFARLLALYLPAPPARLPARRRAVTCFDSAFDALHDAEIEDGSYSSSSSLSSVEDDPDRAGDGGDGAVCFFFFMARLPSVPLLWALFMLFDMSFLHCLLQTGTPSTKTAK